MAQSPPEDTVRSYLFAGVAADTYYADEAKALADELERHRQQLIDSNLGALCQRPLELFADREALAVARLFDPAPRSGATYTARSIPAVLQVLEDHASVWHIQNRPLLIRANSHRRGSEQDVVHLSDTRLTDVAVATFTGELKQLNPHLSALREARNNVIAHNEEIDPAKRNRPRWGMLLLRLPLRRRLSSP